MSYLEGSKDIAWSDVVLFLLFLHLILGLLFTGGMFMATGSTDHMIRVYYIGAETPMKVAEMDAHTVKRTGLQLLLLSDSISVFEKWS